MLFLRIHSIKNLLGGLLWFYTQLDALKECSRATVQAQENDFGLPVHFSGKFARSYTK